MIKIYNNLTYIYIYIKFIILQNSSPDAVKNFSFREYSNIQIWQDDLMEVAVFFVFKEQVRHPDHVSLGQG